MIKLGTTRIVFLIGSYAIKIPRFYGWRSILKGILGNLDEYKWYKHSPVEWQLKMCPTLFTFAGLFNVCKRACPILIEDYQELDFTYYEPLPLDKKLGNFGRYQNRIVLVDYADSRFFCSDCEKIFCLKNNCHE